MKFQPDHSCLHHSRRDRSFVAALLAVVGMLSVQACGRGATPEDLARAKKLAPTGAQLYADNCSLCHGQSGEGGAGAPRVMGPGALPVKVKERQSLQFDTSEEGQARQERQLEKSQAGSGVAADETRRRFMNANDMYLYMTEDHPSTRSGLEDKEYWAIMTYILSAHGLAIPKEGLNASNAASVENSR